MDELTVTSEKLKEEINNKSRDLLRAGSNDFELELFFES